MFVRACLIAGALAASGCDLLEPRSNAADPAPADAAPTPAPDATPGASHVLPADAAVPSVADALELASQIRVYDGLSDAALEASGGVLARGTGKAGGVVVRYWDFGAAQLDGNFAIKSPVYVLADDDGAGGYTPRADHPYLLDSIPGDPRYSAVREVFYLPVTAAYAGERLTSIEALAEAFALGLVGEPVAKGTWMIMPVVAVGTLLELGGSSAPRAATEAYARGLRVEQFVLGYEQPLRNGLVPIGQEARLLSGVASGSPAVLPTSPDAQPVFQYAIPLAPPTTTFNSTPLVTALEVRLAGGVAPADIDEDADLFSRGGTGAISGYRTDNVASYAVTTTVSIRQVQFAEGEP
jgi:hypothetical protein